ncbi:MAG: IPT/TIG domain-containing protein, partial [Planctomycetes bacterium]|nr:IPT/TIG domain-containing protein [Planctomycetota bacterium]
MARKQLLIATPVLLLLFFAVAWAGFRPEGVPLLPLIGSSDDKSSNEIADKPLDDSPPRLDEDTPVGDLPEANTEGDIPAGIDETERERIKQAREEARIEAERLAAEEAKSGPKPPAPPPVSPGSEGAPDNRTPEQKALDAERQRRIDALKAIKRPPNQSLGNVRPRSRRLKAEAGKKELGEISPKLLQDRRGLYAKYYAFNELPLSAIIDPTQPELDARTPDITRIDPQVYFENKEAWADLPFDKRNFMGVWTGYLVIKEDADYWLYLGADYTGVVTLDGESILFNDMRDYTEVSTVLTLTAGLHPIRIDYMEGENGSPVDPLAACNFMWVPEGKSKPVPVPPEMLMLPEALWSNNAPIITRLSKYEGEIGEEVTIHGQNLAGAVSQPVNVLNDEVDNAPSLIRVSFSGQFAEVIKAEDSSIKVRVPIGASTGKLVVYKYPPVGFGGHGRSADVIYLNSVPSNSVDFTVTTQFGLFASWHNLQGWSNYDFIDESVHAPDVVRLEREFMFETRDDIEHPFRDNPLACHWEGKLGVPANWVSEGEIALVRFQTYGRLRVKLGDQMRETNAQTGGSFDLTTIDFEVRNHEEHYLPLSIDWTSESGAAGLKVVKMVSGGEILDSPGGQTEVIWTEIETLQAQLFFPPVVPPKPPVILSAKPIFEEGQQPPLLPFALNTTRPSIREGQVFEFDMEVFGNAEVLAAPVNITVDGVPLVYEVTQTETGNGGGMIRTCRATLPTGLGEGAIVARLTVVTSEPFYIDVQNKGL